MSAGTLSPSLAGAEQFRQAVPRWSSARLTALAATALAGGLLVYLAVAIPQMHKPLMYDDVPFASGALAAAATGKALGYQGWMSNLGDYTVRDQWALWHPPLYVYLLAAWSLLFGSEPAALRAFGLVSGVLSAGLTFVLAGQLTRGTDGEKRLAGGLAAALTLTSPIYVQSVQILDIDFPLLLPLTLLFVVLYLRWEQTYRWLWLIPLFALMLWAKMTNPFPVLGAALAWQLVRGQPRRVLMHGAAIGVGGTALFAATWVGTGSVVGWPLEMPFQVNLAQWRDSAGGSVLAYRSFANVVASLRPTIAWVGPLLVLLGLVAGAVRAASLVRAGTWKKTDLVLILCLLLAAGYVNKTAGWLPKYQVVLVPLLAAVSGPLVARGLVAHGRTRALGGLAVTGALFLSWGWVGDAWIRARTYQLDDRAAFGLALLLALLGAAILVMRLPAAVPVVLAGLAVGWGAGSGASFVDKPYSTHYLYGTTGVEEAAAWVDRYVEPAETYVASKDVGWYSNRPNWVDVESLYAVLMLGRPDFSDGRWQGLPVQTIVAWVGEPSIEAMLQERLPPHGYVSTERIGDFLVYQRRPGP